MTKKQWIKVAVAPLAMIALSCSRCDLACKGLESETRGLHRTITVYTIMGEPVRSWNTKSLVDMSGNQTVFLDSLGKRVRVDGVYIVVNEEK